MLLRHVRAYLFTRADYYEHSAPLEVALRRESRGTPSRYVLAHRRVPTHLFVRPRWSILTRKECIGLRFMPVQGVTSFSGVLPMGAHLHQSRLGFRQSSFTHSERAIRLPCPTTLSDMYRLPNMLTCEIRRSRYIGQKKLNLQAFLTATSMNVLRACHWVGEEKHAAAPSSRFAKLVAFVQHASAA